MPALKYSALALLAGTALADIPAHCVRDTTLGSWTFYLGKDGQGNDVDCSGFTKDDAVDSFTVDLSDPSTAKSDSEGEGFWTLVYDQGFEVTFEDRTFWGFFDYSTDEAGDVTSYCGKTSPGWGHEVGVLPKNWMCYVAEHADNADVAATHTPKARPSEDAVIGADDEFVDRLRAKASSWSVGERSYFHGMSAADASKMGGSVVHHERTVRAATTGVTHVEGLPDAFDWIADGGLDIPVRDQLNCGSCYAFASTTMFNGLARIAGNDEVIYSPQNLVSCSNYAQGCDGGFPYLMARYANDFGTLEDRDFPYQNGIRDDVQCSWAAPDADRLIVTNGTYVGGFYGGCSAEAMMEALVNEGPLAVSFEVEDDFMYYTGGVYVPSGLTSAASGVNPWVETNHVVVVVGYGTDEDTGLPYWNVLNSWGFHFGESGFFRIVRGEDACGIETMAVTADVSF